MSDENKQEKLKLVDSITLGVPNESKDQAGVGGSAITHGNIIFTDSLGPCQGVIAKLKNGEFAIYHASAPTSDVPGFSPFIQLVKDNIQEIYVLQKTSNPQNNEKAPILVNALQEALGVEVGLKKLAYYTAIVCNAENQKVYVITSSLKKQLVPVSQSQISIVGFNQLSDEEKLMNALVGGNEEQILQLMQEKKFSKKDRIFIAMNLENPTILNNFLNWGLGEDFDEINLLILFKKFITQANNVDVQKLWQTIFSNKNIPAQRLKILLETPYSQDHWNMEINAAIAAVIVLSGRTRYVGRRGILSLLRYPIVANALLGKRNLLESLADIKKEEKLRHCIRYLGEDFVMILFEKGRFLDKTFSRQEKLRMALDYRNVAEALVMDVQYRHMFNQKEWIALILKHPSVATMALSNMSWDIFDKAQKDELLGIALQNPQNAYHVFLQCAYDVKKQNKFLPVELAAIVKNIDIQLLKAIPGRIFEKIQLKFLSVLLTKNLYVAISIVKSYSGSQHRGVIGLAVSLLSEAIKELSPSERAIEIQALKSNLIFMKDFGGKCADIFKESEVKKSIKDSSPSEVPGSFFHVNQPPASVPAEVAKNSGKPEEKAKTDSSPLQ